MEKIALVAIWATSAGEEEATELVARRVCSCVASIADDDASGLR